MKLGFVSELDVLPVFLKLFIIEIESLDWDFLSFILGYKVQEFIAPSFRTVLEILLREKPQEKPQTEDFPIPYSCS